MSGRDELLNEAIAKAKEAEDWQLVEWLRMARGGESAARWYSDKLREAHRAERKLLDENAKLRVLVLRLHKATQILRCNEVDGWYCQSECPLGIDKDSCTVTELADKAKELGIDVFLDSMLEQAASSCHIVDV